MPCRRDCSIPIADAWNRRFARLGISQDSDVVIYSNPFDNWGDEGRMFWMLEYLGHTRLRILDGGWVKWVQEKRPFEHGRVTPKPGTFTVKPVAAVIIGKDELKHLVKQPHPAPLIVDARSLEEYLGKEVSGIPRPGHIPSAIHLAWNGFLQADATVKDLQAITESLDEKGLHRIKKSSATAPAASVHPGCILCSNSPGIGRSATIQDPGGSGVGISPVRSKKMPRDCRKY